MTLKLTKTTTATSYTLVNDGDFGWAICTVDDSTGVLAIVSDWGSWAYRWGPDPRSLGAPTLTAFIARGSIDYLARKLHGGDGRRFSAERTVAAWQKQLCARRLDEGRGIGGHAALSREVARMLWDDLDGLLEFDSSSDLFIANAYEIHGFTDWISEFPYEDLETEQTAEDRALRETILPALVAVLRDRIGEVP